MIVRFFASLALALALSVCPLFSANIAVTASTNGTLLAPTNFFRANSNAMTAITGTAALNQVNTASNALAAYKLNSTNGTAYNLAIATGTQTNITERMGTNINPVIQGAREISGNIGLITNGTMRGTVLTNVTVSGTLSGPGDIGTNSQKFGLNSYAGGNFSLALGYNARAEAGGDDSTTGNFGTAVGCGSVASGYGTALGGNAYASLDNSAAIGYFAIATAANQFRLGNSSNVFVFGGNGAITGNGSGLTNLNLNTLSNRVVQAEGTNAVQQTALAGLTNSIASLNTNYIATTNGMSRNLTNLGAMYSDRLVVTNLIVGTNVSTVQITNGTIIATGAITAAAINSSGNVLINSGSIFGTANKGAFAADSRESGALNMYRTDTGRFSSLNWGHESIANGMAILYTGLTGSDMVLMNGGRNFSASTNKFTVPRFQVSSNSFSAIVTNIMATNVVWDFPSTSSGSVADLGANITGVKDGDQVIVSPPQAAMTGIIGFYTGFASNGVAYGRFVPTAATQNPASATFRVVVTQYQ